jgi:hypothetical protein
MLHSTPPTLAGMRGRLSAAAPSLASIAALYALADRLSRADAPAGAAAHSSRHRTQHTAGTPTTEV